MNELKRNTHWNEIMRQHKCPLMILRLVLVKDRLFTHEDANKIRTNHLSCQKKLETLLCIKCSHWASTVKCTLWNFLQCKSCQHLLHKTLAQPIGLSRTWLGECLFCISHELSSSNNLFGYFYVPILWCSYHICISYMHSHHHWYF